MASVEEIGEALLHLVGDVEREGLDGGRWIDPARGNEDAAVDDEEVLTSCARPHSLTTERSGSVPMRAVPSRCQPPQEIGELTQMSLAPAVSRISRPRASACSIIFRLFSLIV